MKLADILASLQKLFPHGSPRFIPITVAEMELHSAKNHDYAGPGADPLGNFRRRAAIYAFYPGLELSDPAVVAAVDMLKQLDAYLHFKSRKHQARVEGKVARLRDVSVYAKLCQILEGEEETNERDNISTGCYREGTERCAFESATGDREVSSTSEEGVAKERRGGTFFPRFS